jgi:hypothetical protein
VANYFAQLPAYRDPGGLEFSPLNQAVQNFGETNRQNAMATYQAGQNRKAEGRANAAAGRAAESFDMQKTEFRQQQQDRAHKALAATFQAIGSSPAEQRAALYGQVRQSVKDFDNDVRAMGGNPDDMDSTMRLITAQATGYQPREAGKLVEIYDPETGHPRKVVMGADGSYKPVGGVRAPEKRDAGLSVIEKKQVFDSEDALPALDATVSALNRAKELNAKTFEGVASGVRGSIGTMFAPNSTAGQVVGQVFDRGASDATSEWGKLMNMEAIQSMAATLKGATTNFELKEFVNILADPSTPPPIRARTIDRMLTLAEGRRQTAQRRIQELRSTGLRPSSGSAPAPREQVNPQTGEQANPNVIDLGDGFSMEFSQ